MPNKFIEEEVITDQEEVDLKGYLNIPIPQEIINLGKDEDGNDVYFCYFDDYRELDFYFMRTVGDKKFYSEIVSSKKKDMWHNMSEIIFLNIKAINTN